MKEVIWVVGPSAVGKETFIKKIASDARTLRLLRLEDKSIVSCGASYHFNGKYEGDVVDEAREKIFDEIPDLLEDYDVVFIKWQYIDSKLNRLSRLRNLLPNVNHKVLLLVAPKHELVKRLPEKSWWQDFGNEQAHVDAGITHLKSCLKSLPKSITVTAILNSEKEAYSLISNDANIENLY